MLIKSSISYRIFSIFNYILMLVLAFTCIFPMLNVLAISLSNGEMVLAGKVWLLPKGTTLASYIEILRNPSIFRAFGVSFARVIVGTSVSMFFTVITAYALSREDELKGRMAFIWFVVFTMLFGGGLIPTYLLIRDLHLMNSFWVMIIPGAVPVFSAIMMMNFFRGLPASLYEAALIDGASHFTVLMRIFIPLSMPSIATLTLFAMVGNWNSWFDALIYINDSKKWPLQTILMMFLRSQSDVAIGMAASKGDMEAVRRLSSRTLAAAQIFVVTIPIILVYPFLQKHFTKGIVVGAVKG